LTPEQSSILTPEEQRTLRQHSVVVRHRLEEQYANLEQQHETASVGMWVFLATEVIFFGALFVGLAAYRFLYQEAFDRASERLNWMVGGINTVVLLVSSTFMVLGVHAAKVGNRRALVRYLLLTAALGFGFLGFKAYEYYTDYRDNLIPGWRFEDKEWTSAEGLRPDQKPLPAEEVPHVKLFLLFYWIMTGIHGLHVTIGIAVLLVIAYLAHRGHYSPAYYSPVDVAGLYWHFVDTVWIFLLPMLYLLGTHTWADVHF
jgi:cytochrome c oxidase subunit 3